MIRPALLREGGLFYFRDNISRLHKTENTMRPQLLLALLATTGTCAGAPVDHQQKIWNIVQMSDPLFHYGWNPNDVLEKAHHTRVVRAREWFRAMGAFRRSAALHAALLELPTGSAARKAVAYVAGMHGLNVPTNIARLARGGQSPARIWGHSDIGGMAEDTYSRVYDVYRQYPSARARQLVLRLSSDGAGEEMLIGVRLDMLRREPASVLQTVSHDAVALERMRFTLENDGGQDEKRVLHRFRQDPSRAIRRAVWLCLRSKSDGDIRQARYKRAEEKALGSTQSTR